MDRSLVAGLDGPLVDPARAKAAAPFGARAPAPPSSGKRAKSRQSGQTPASLSQAPLPPLPPPHRRESRRGPAFPDFEAAKAACRQPEPSGASPRRRAKRGFTYPGTLWCGAGNIAESYEQLGAHRETDRCCREHDHCQDVIHPFTMKFGYRNFRWHTISHCDCDKRLKACLRRVNDTASRVVGQAFFNVIQVPCFEFVYKEQCVEPYLYVWCKNYSTVIVAVAQEPVLYDYGGEVIDGPATQRPPATSTSAAPRRESTTAGTQVRPSGSPPKRRKGKGKGRKGRKGKGLKVTKGAESVKPLNGQGLGKDAFQGQKLPVTEEETFNAILSDEPAGLWTKKTGTAEPPSLQPLPAPSQKKRKGRRKRLRLQKPS
ncbi:PREDICTED: protein PROCA1 [Gekko japonicus]|uniref:Protein PROCA1 n=1 Tax=Gekko japonicus TaxID=146911 RepID=A0ABM1KUF5_GEKJA|nr:PREDICTED: protein PROCA1 [Gekko japonicus]